MPIELSSPTSARTPVLRRRQLGESFVGALVRFEQRQQIRDEVPLVKSNGKPRMELVVTMVALPGATMNAGLGDDESVPEPGDVVRVILKGGGFGAWIDADKALKPRQVGDIVVITSDHGQVYSASGTPEGQPLTSQDEVVAAKMKGKTVGIYGSLTIRRPTAAEAQWVTAAEAAYTEAEQAARPVLDSPADDPADFL
jgi:hypothetical protein